MDKRLYEKYKVQIDDKLKQDMINVCCKVYGEQYRSKFEENLSRVSVHARFTIEELENFLRNNPDIEEDISLEEEAIREYKEDKARIEKENDEKKIGLQLEVLDKIKDELAPEDRKKLEEELQTLGLQENSRKFDMFSAIDLEMKELFDGVDLTTLKRIVDDYGLNSMTNNKKENRKPFVREYEENVNALEIKGRKELTVKHSSYENMQEELAEVDLDDLDLTEEVMIPGSFVTTLLRKDDGKKPEDHVFLNLASKEKRLGKLVHEMLHSMEKTRRINPNTGEYEEKTGFREYDSEQENDIDEDDLTLESECMHDIILHTRIYPELRKLGYEVDDENDYGLYNLSANNKFFTRFEQEILDARCGNSEPLYAAVGKENFKRLIQLQGQIKGLLGDKEKRVLIEREAKSVVEAMEEHAKFVSSEKEVKPLDLKSAYESAKINQEDLNGAYETIRRTKEEREESRTNDGESREE